mgnify:CR=1 FL=1
MVEMVCIRTFKGSRDEGFVSRGETFTTTERRAALHEDVGRAHPMGKAETPAYTDKMQRPEHTDKERSWDASGSWKTLYEGGDEVAKVQATQEEAEAWANRDATLDEIQ